MLGYGIFGCILPAVFSLTDIKYVESRIAKVHNLFYMFGHICLQIAALCMTGIAFEQGDFMRGAIFSILCLVTIFLYMIYNMRARYVYLLKNRNLNYKADRRMYIAF